METDKHYLRVGVFVLLTMLGAALFSVWIAGTHNKNLYMLYRIRFAESVSGLEVGGPVKFRGVQIGKVKAMSIDPEDTRLIRVDVSILKSAPVKTDTVASLKLQGITGTVYVELTGNNPQAPDLVSDSDKEKGTDTIPEIRAEPSTLETLMDMLPKLAQKMSHMVGQGDKLLSERNIAAFSEILRNLEAASRTMNELMQSLKDDPSQLLNPPKKKKAKSDSFW